MSSSPRILLVHGSWLGTWTWAPVSALLVARGFESDAVALKGLGIRADEAAVDVGLQDHVADVLAAIDSTSDGQCLLVGHSYGAVVAAQAAASRPDRVDGLLVVDGPLAESGKSLFDQMPDLVPSLMGLVVADHPGFLQPPPPAFLGLDASREDLPVIALTAMPLLTHTQPAMHAAADLACRCAFLGFQDFPPTAQIARYADSLGWQVQLMAGGHMTMLDRPWAVADAIAQFSQHR